jgi:sulfur-oxidizing protein SoxX
VPQEPFQGEIGPDLEHIGSRLSPGQIRLRVVDAARLNPATVMPPNHRISGLRRVSSAYAGKPVLTAQDVENVVAWLESLK